jgi:hypothetical protein
MNFHEAAFIVLRNTLPGSAPVPNSYEAALAVLEHANAENMIAHGTMVFDAAAEIVEHHLDEINCSLPDEMHDETLDATPELPRSAWTMSFTYDGYDRTIEGPELDHRYGLVRGTETIKTPTASTAVRNSYLQPAGNYASQDIKAFKVVDIKRWNESVYLNGEQMPLVEVIEALDSTSPVYL